MYEAEISELSDVFVSLDSATDAVSVALSGLSERLARIRCSVSVWLDELLDGGYQLGFGKAGNKWCIVARKTPDGSPVEITQAPRIVRMQAIDRLDALVAALLLKAKVYDRDMKEAANKLSLRVVSRGL